MLGALLATSVQAAPPDFCRDYARSAVDQARFGYSQRFCAEGMGGARWNSDWRAHYEWCRGAPYEAVERERSIRHHYLERCRYR